MILGGIMLELRDICKEYHTGGSVQKALDHVNLKLADTEFVAILGPSGSGKTTLLNIIGGLDRYTSGDLIIDGISTKNYTDRDWDAYRNHAIGFVFQSYNLIMHQTILSNVELALTISGVSGEERRKRAEDALRSVGLEEHMHKKPNQLSGGQMQRVAIARALVNNPSIVLADEPTGALDSETSIQVMDILKEVARDRLVVMVTHNPELAEKYATRIVTIKDGRFAGSRDLPQTFADGRKSAEMQRDADGQKSAEVQCDVVGRNTTKVQRDADGRNAEGEQNAAEERSEHEKNSVRNGRFQHTSMNFLTALQLSFQNLRTKKARTFMVSFAGSIGIIGIALILAIETGLQAYVRKTESATLSQYPIEIYSTGIDWTSLMSESSGMSSVTSLTGQDSGEAVVSGSDEIAVNTLAKDIFTGVNNNDLGSLKKYLESGETDILDYTMDIEYRYGVEPQIYDIEDDGTIEQLNPNRMLSDMLTSIIDVSSLMDGFVGESLFHPMPSDESLYEDSYDVKAGRWPENDHEIVLVLNSDGQVSDFILYELGILDPDELRDMIQEFSSGSDNSVMALANKAESVVGGDETAAESSGSDTTASASSAGEEADGDSGVESVEGSSEVSQSSEQVSSSSEESSAVCHYSDFIGKKFKLIYSSDTVVYDEDMGVWSSRADDEDYISSLVQNGEDMEIVGIVQPKEDASNQMLSVGLDYPGELISQIIERESESDPVQAQLQNPDVDIFTGEKFSDESSSNFDLTQFVTLDHDDVAKAFHVTTDSASSDTVQDYLSSEIDKMSSQIVDYASEKAQEMMSQMTLSDFIDIDALQQSMPELTEEDINEILDAAFSSLSEEAVSQTVQELGSGWMASVKEQWENDETLVDQDTWEGLFESLIGYVTTYISSDEARQVIEDQVDQILEENLEQLSQEKLQSMLQEELQAYASWVSTQNEERAEDEQLNADDPEVIAAYLASTEGQARIEALVSYFSQISVQFDGSQLQQISDALIQDFSDYAAENEIPGLEEAADELADALADSFTEYITDADTEQMIRSSVTQVLNGDALKEAVTEAVESKITGLEGDVEDEITSQITEAASSAIDSFAADVVEQSKQIVIGTITEDYPGFADEINQNIGDFFTIDEEAFRDAIKVNAGASEIQSILASFLNGDEATFESNLSELGYADLDEPTEILIYPKDFDAKNHIADLITEYNDEMKAKGEDDKVITYSDVVATMMQSVTDIINSISRILIAFVSISLVVSSIMIGVITYISVLERKKEIGILRALGASKHNIREVFNAETVITGFISGCLGVGITYALIPLADYIILTKTGQSITAMLTPLMAGALVLLSVLLTLLAGLIPSGRAAKSDPVEALRSE
jgi:ABC-type lipoprotein export system ATPase subunit/ABC-type lipoprotein release transport system permease subunit